MRLMYDSTTARDIPADAAMVAGYVDGLYRWSAADWARFARAVRIQIACFAATNDGDVLDVETGDATPPQAPGWVARRRMAGRDPAVYVNRSNIGAVRAAFAAARIAQPHYWLSTLDGSRPWAPGIVAIQHSGSATSGGHYDLSDVLDSWPAMSPDAAPQPMPDGWADWQRMPGIAKALTVAGQLPGRLDLFVVGQDDAVYHTWWPK